MFLIVLINNRSYSVVPYLMFDRNEKEAVSDRSIVFNWL